MYKFVPTDDGSPTLEYWNPDGYAEKMHSFRGAFSETLYIYGAALEASLQYKWAHRYLVVGLGLGYIEIMVAAQMLALSIEEKLEDMLTFESESWLTDGFVSWLNGDSTSELGATLDDITHRYSQHYNVPSQKIRDVLKQWNQNKKWQIRGALTEAELINLKAHYNVIFFDAFSSEMTPQLWTEEFLLQFLKSACAPNSILTTYAAKGHLTRALRASHFSVEKKVGYAGKRECTWAIRQNLSAF